MDPKGVQWVGGTLWFWHPRLLKAPNTSKDVPETQNDRKKLLHLSAL
jgi:hypothetical protein